MRRMQKLVVGAMVALLASVSMARMISVNVTDYVSLRNSLPAAGLAGAPGVRTNNWNNLKATSNTTLGGDLVYDDGTPVGGDFQIVQSTPRSGSSSELSRTNDAVMFAGSDQVWNGQTVTYTLTNIPFASYDVYAYVGTARANCGGSIALSGKPTYYVKTMSTLAITTQADGSGYTQITGTDYATVKSGAATKDNYVLFSGLSGSSRVLSVSAMDMGDTTTQRMNIFGFQIVEVSETPPAASFSALPVDGSVPLTVTFTDTSSGTITNLYWDFGDGATTNTTENAVSHTYTSVGAYSVTMVASGPLGVSTNAQADLITVSPAVIPVAEFSAAPTSGEVALVVTFTDTSTGSITNRAWDFGDGFTTNTMATSVVHTYMTEGIYTVSLVASGAAGVSTNTQTDLITVALPAAPVAGFSATPTSGLAPLIVNFTDTSTGSITNRAWDFGDGTTTNITATSISHVYADAGTYTVSLVASGYGGADADTQADLINVYPNPSIRVVANGNDQQWSGVSGTASSAWSGNSTATSGSATLPSLVKYVIPFQLPDIASGTITNVQLGAFLISGYPFGGAQEVYIDVYAGRVDTNSVTVVGDWDYGTQVGDNIAKIENGAETSNTLKTVELTAAYFQDIYDNDPAAAGKYIFLTLGPDATPASGSSYVTWATANNAAVERRPVLSFFVADGYVPPPPPPPPAPVVTFNARGSGQDVINWTTAQGSGYVYSVWYSTNLLSGFQPLETNLPDTVQGITNIISAPACFYQIRAQ